MNASRSRAITSKQYRDAYKAYSVYANAICSASNASHANLEFYFDEIILLNVVVATYDDIDRYKSYHLRNSGNSKSDVVKRAAYFTKWTTKLRPIMFKRLPSSTLAATPDIGKAEERLSRLTDAFLDGSIDKETFEARKTALFAERRALLDIGLSLSSISMNLGTGRLGKKLEEDGVDISLYFLDPNGKFVYQRELEEGYHNGELSALTKTSISAVRRAINGTTNAHKCTIRVYDCPLRYNIYIFDDNVAVLQFYGASARGVDSPCFIVKKTAQGGLFDFARNNFDIITSGAYAFDENTGLASRQHPNIKSTSRLWQTIRSTVLK
jgi:hypothetical protein